MEAMGQMAQNELVRPGYIEDADMSGLYSGASLFVYPSHYEGWGMQPLEAMACGVPVITSNNSSLPEVVGDAGIMVSANDATALSGAIERVLTSREMRAKMRAGGLSQAKKFRWDSSAQEFLDLVNGLKE